MILAAAVLPHPPLLFRELTGGQDVAEDLRRACVSAVRAVLEDRPDVVVVVGGHDATATWDPSLAPQVAGYGANGPRRGPGLPLSLGVARRLLDEAGWTGPVVMETIRWSAGAVEADVLAERIAARPDRVTLLVLGDGSARRGEKAPGHVDERAFRFDDEVAAALAGGDADTLAALDAGLAADLLVAGRAAFAVLGSVGRRAARPRDVALTYRADPFGVSYYVAVWRFG